MLYLELVWEFLKTGLFSIGGGLATLPFLYSIADRYDWLNRAIMPDLIAISEATPGPIGINAATFAGFNAGIRDGLGMGIIGGILASLALVLPAFFIVLLISRFLDKFNENKLVQSAFYSLRPAVTGLIIAAGYEILKVSVLTFQRFQETGLWYKIFDYKALILLGVLLFASFKWKKLHPVVFIAAAAVVGIIFRF